MLNVHNDKICYSITDAAALLSVGRRTLYREINAGHIATIKMGRRTLIPASAIQNWMKTASQPAKAAAQLQN